MTLDLYLPFVLACFAVLGTPGPTILLVLAYNLAHGRRAVTWAAGGVFLGDALAAIMVIIGLSTLLATIPQLFTIIKWLGVIYLVYLAYGMISTALRRGKGSSYAEVDAHFDGAAILRHCFTVTALNAKGIVFLSAFLPGFINSEAARLPQLALLGTTFVVLGGVNAFIWGWFAARGGELFRSDAYRFWLNLLGGLFLLIAAIAVALTRVG